MIKRLHLPLPAAARRARGDAPVRLLAISDERSPSLEFDRNRADLGRVDAVLGAGDLEPDYLAFLADAFAAPLLYVRGNHDRDAGWTVGQEHVPEPLNGHFETIEGIKLCGLSWPGKDRGRAERDGAAAWWQAAGAAARAGVSRTRPDIVLSHVPPRGLNDDVRDEFHRGFSGYHWLCRTIHPALWLHGHTPTPAAADWRTTWADTTLINVTGGVLIEFN